MFKAKGTSCKRLSTPCGYFRAEEGNLSADPEIVPIVRLIFQLAAEGNGPGKISRRLQKMKIIAPGTLEFERTGRKTHYDPDSPLPLLQQHGKILKNRDDPGHTVTFKTTSLSVLQAKKQFDNPTAPFLKCPPIMRQSRSFYRLIWKNCGRL